MELRRFRRKDMSKFLAWVKSEAEMVAWAGAAFTWPLTQQQFRRHLETAAADPPVLYPFGFYEGKELVGYCELSDYRRGADSAMFSRVIVCPDQRGKGRGSFMVQQVLAFGFSDLALNRIGLGVFESNEAAIRCYSKTGFRGEGTLRESARVGDAYWNCHIMSILYKEWRPAQTEDGST
jgi:RimJ/RimL family protein N-acetyltransferase